MKLEIGDGIYELEYTVNAVCDLEELTGKNLGDVLATAGLSSVRALLWCGLIEHAKTLTMAKAGSLLQEYMKAHSMEELVELLGKAIEDAGFIQAQGRPVKKAK